MFSIYENDKSVNRFVLKRTGKGVNHYENGKKKHKTRFLIRGGDLCYDAAGRSIRLRLMAFALRARLSEPL